VQRYDVLAVDEIQTISFGNDKDCAGSLKNYLELGKFSVGQYSASSEAGMILLGNIQLGRDKTPKNPNYTSALPKIFSESALLVRFHGFIEGWKLPKLDPSQFIDGYSLNIEYFSEILHALRRENIYSKIVKEMLEMPEKANARDVTAVIRITTAYMKLLFPHITKVEDMDPIEFKRWCFDPAYEMRGIIKEQLHMIDSGEYDTPNLPDIKVKGV